MLTLKQLEILNVFWREPWREFSFSDLKRLLNESSSSKLQKAIGNFKKENLVNISIVGRTSLISLNFENNKLFDYLSLLDFEFRKIPLDILLLIQKEILKESEFFSIVVFGSYVSGEQKKGSDLDVAIVVESEDVKKRIVPVVKSVKRKSLIEIHDLVFTREEFLEMLCVDEENVGKEIARKNYVFYGLVNFYKLISKEGRWRN